MLSVAQALDKILALAPVMPVEMVRLEHAAGRYLASDLNAVRDQPPFPASAMDGYAVRASDAHEGAILSVTGEAAAGHCWEDPLAPNCAIRIFTGAPVPAGADTILIQENAERAGDRIRVTSAPTLGEFVRPAGGDFQAGYSVHAPRRLTSRDIALFAAMNIPVVPVRRRPVIALIPTGDELVQPGEAPGPNQIIASNNFGLAAMLDAAGAETRQCPIARDTPESLRASFATAEGSDIIVSLGGASVGDHDLVAEVITDVGLELDFYKVAMRPGKPLMAGRLGQAMMIGLPGNPVSALVCGEVFLRPAIDKTLGLPGAARQTQIGQISHDLDANGPREHYMRARVTLSPKHGLLVEVFENQDSSRLATLARANALVVRKPHAGPISQGEQVAFIALD
ncbi:MAG: gephyrin-like molybdotransferase Glp [Pseudomonadota bacterium]